MVIVNCSWLQAFATSFFRANMWDICIGGIAGYLASYLLKKFLIGRPTSAVSLDFFLPGCAFWPAGILSLPAWSVPAAVLSLFTASLRVRNFHILCCDLFTSLLCPSLHFEWQCTGFYSHTCCFYEKSWSQQRYMNPIKRCFQLHE